MNPSDLTLFMFRIAWIGMLGGVVSGAVIGLFFHREDWMGGYQSFRRRLTRLGHISFFGLAFVNISFAATHHIVTIASPWSGYAGVAFTVGALAMPTFCFLTAWRKPFRHGFFIPVSGVLLGIVFTLLGWPSA